MNSLIKAITALLLAAITSMYGQEQATDSILSHQQMGVVVDSLKAALNETYVFPEVAQKMGDYVEAQYQKGVYRELGNGRLIADQLTEDLRSVSHDGHIRLRYNPERIREYLSATTAEDSLAMRERWISEMKSTNFGFHQVKILEGNIGYLDLRAFMDPEFAGETATAAMNFLSNADALIIDLRKNGGGSPSMIQLLTSYLYDSDPVHLNNFYWRPTDTRTQTWTLPFVPGKRRPDIPVYVLTSNRTFSAAEEFTYNLKNLERGTVIGETTGGGAHPGGIHHLADTFMIFIPAGRAINPVTNTNWEGTGVTPHIESNAEEALTLARKTALEHMLSQTEDEAGKKRYEQLLMDLKSETEQQKNKG